MEDEIYENELKIINSFIVKEGVSDFVKRISFFSTKLRKDNYLYELFFHEKIKGFGKRLKFRK